MGWAEASRTHFRGNPLCVKCWCCLQHDSVLQHVTWSLRCLLTWQMSSAPGDSGPALCSHPSFLTPGRLLGRARVAVRCVPPAPGAYPNLLNLAVLGGSREDTETAVQAPWGAWYSLLWQPAAKLSSSLHPVCPRAACPEHLIPGRLSPPPSQRTDWPPQAKIHCKEKFSKKIQSLPETQAECLPQK